LPGILLAIFLTLLLKSTNPASGNGMKKLLNCLALVLTLSSLTGTTAVWAAGPYSPESWPATIDKNKTVHYVVTDPGLNAPGANWIADGLSILTGGDQVTTDYCIKGHACKKVTSQFLNVLDATPDFWADKDTIDILVQVYGDSSLFNANGTPRDFNFLEGALPNITAPVGGQVPAEALNKQWNWVLFSVTNALDVTGERYVRGPGVNGGTIRFEQVPNLIVRVIAFGEAAPSVPRTTSTCSTPHREAVTRRLPIWPASISTLAPPITWSCSTTVIKRLLW